MERDVISNETPPASLITGDDSGERRSIPVSRRLPKRQGKELSVRPTENIFLCLCPSMDKIMKTGGNNRKVQRSGR